MPTIQDERRRQRSQQTGQVLGHALQMHAQQMALSQREQMDLQRQENQIGAIQQAVRDGHISANDARDHILELRTGVNQYRARQAQTQQLLQEQQLQHATRANQLQQIQLNQNLQVAAGGIHSIMQPVFSRSWMAPHIARMIQEGARPEEAERLATAAANEEMLQAHRQGRRSQAYLGHAIPEHTAHGVNLRWIPQNEMLGGAGQGAGGEGAAASGQGGGGLPLNAAHLQHHHDEAAKALMALRPIHPGLDAPADALRKYREDMVKWHNEVGLEAQSRARGHIAANPAAIPAAPEGPTAMQRLQGIGQRISTLPENVRGRYAAAHEEATRLLTESNGNLGNLRPAQREQLQIHLGALEGTPFPEPNRPMQGGAAAQVPAVELNAQNAGPGAGIARVMVGGARAVQQGAGAVMGAVNPQRWWPWAQGEE